MKKKILLTLVLAITLIFTIHTFSFADVGSFDRYDSGSSSWGSSSSDWGSSSSSWDWGSSSSSYDYDSDSDGLGIIGLLFGLLGGGGGGTFVIIIIIVYLIYRASRRNRGDRPVQQQSTYTPPRNVPSSVYTTNVHDVPQTHVHAERIKEIDPNFSEEKMISYAKDLFVKLQNAWTAREWEEMRPLETESLFEQHNKQIQNYIDTNRINVVDRIAVNYATICGFRQEGDRDILEVALKATMKDYIIDATTKELLEGIKEQDRITVYKLTFERKTGVLTPEGTEEIKTTNCPNCGAPTKITSAGKCPYCGSVITTGNNTWVLSGLEPYRN